MSTIPEERFAALEKSVKQIVANQEYLKTMAYAIVNKLLPENRDTIDAMARDAEKKFFK